MKLKHLLCSALVLFTLASCIVGPGYRRPPVRPIGRPVVLPYGARPYNHAGVRYYNHRGIWYRPNGGGHIICPRPF